MPLKTGPGEVLAELSALGKPLWVDLKGRQLRVVGAAIPPYTEIRVSHPVRVETPADIYFSDGKEHGRVVAVDGDRLILEDGPRRLIGPGESVNILHPSLKISGTLTPTDQAYLQAMAPLGLNRVMLSYVETPADIQEIANFLPDPVVLAKIETEKGLEYARKFGSQYGHLIAARGDLYVEVVRPHRMPAAVAAVVKADPRAYAASRIFDSLADHPVPTNADISDFAFLLQLGYRRFMLGDRICFHRETILEALNLIDTLAADFAENFGPDPAI
jgi:pyruvate kinase